MIEVVGTERRIRRALRTLPPGEVAWVRNAKPRLAQLIHKIAAGLGFNVSTRVMADGSCIFYRYEGA